MLKRGRKKGRTLLGTLQIILNSIPNNETDAVSINALARKTGVTFYTVKTILEAIEKAQKAPPLELTETTTGFYYVRFKVNEFVKENSNSARVR